MEREIDPRGDPARGHYLSVVDETFRVVDGDPRSQLLNVVYDRVVSRGLKSVKEPKYSRDPRPRTDCGHYICRCLCPFYPFHDLFLLYLSLCTLSARDDQNVYLRMVAETVIGDDDKPVDGFDRASILGNGEYLEGLVVVKFRRG